MKFGIDCSMEVNISEGYMICEYRKKDIIKDGIFSKDARIRFFRHYPDYVLHEIYGTDKPVGQRTIFVDEYFSSNELYEMYLEDKDDIDSFIGMEYHEAPKDIHGALNMASDIDLYKGLK